MKEGFINERLECEKFHDDHDRSQPIHKVHVHKDANVNVSLFEECSEGVQKLSCGVQKFPRG